MSVWVFLPSRLRSSSAPMKRRCFSVLAGIGRASLLVEDLVGLAVDLRLLGLRQVPVVELLRGASFRVPRVRLVGHRVPALIGKPELRLLERVALLLRHVGHRRDPPWRCVVPPSTVHPLGRRPLRTNDAKVLRPSHRSPAYGR